ncbi:MAG: hypothetical protein ACI383_07815 [Rummeliibacillus sp.]
MDYYSNMPLVILKCSPLKWIMDAISLYVNSGNLNGLIKVGFGQLVISGLLYLVLHRKFKPYDFC